MANQVTAEVRYLNDEWKTRDDRPFIHSKETRHANTAKHAVEITDARDLQAAGALDLDTNGFVLAQHVSDVENFHDEAAVKQSYATEIVPLLKSLTGAREVYVSGHQVRTEDPKTFLGAYSRYLHCDYPLVPAAERERKTAGRDLDGADYAWYNIWEPIDRPARQNQLTVVDARTLSPDDIREYHFTDKRENGYAAIPTFSDRHRFYYFSNMRPGEAIVFKQYDSRRDRAMVCPHTAFYDPAADPSADGRRSLEIRALCVF